MEIFKNWSESNVYRKIIYCCEIAQRLNWYDHFILFSEK